MIFLDENLHELGASETDIDVESALLKMRQMILNLSVMVSVLLGWPAFTFPAPKSVE